MQKMEFKKMEFAHRDVYECAIPVEGYPGCEVNLRIVAEKDRWVWRLIINGDPELLAAKCVRVVVRGFASFGVDRERALTQAQGKSCQAADLVLQLMELIYLEKYAA